MACAPYHDLPRSIEVKQETRFGVLEVTVASIDSYRVRSALSAFDGVGVVRCEPLLHPGAAHRNAMPRVRLLVRLPLTSCAGVLHCILDNVPDGEIGPLVGWRTHLKRQGIAHGG